MSQKRKIKSDYLKRRQQQSESAQLEMSSSNNKFKNSIASLKTPISGGGSSKLDISSDSGLDSWKTSLLTDKSSSKREFFPKSWPNLLILSNNYFYSV